MFVSLIISTTTNIYFYCTYVPLRVQASLQRAAFWSQKSVAGQSSLIRHSADAGDIEAAGKGEQKIRTIEGRRIPRNQHTAGLSPQGLFNSTSVLCS